MAAAKILEVRHRSHSSSRHELRAPGNGSRALKVLADKMGSTIIAEGIERREELETLLDIGIIYGQGFLLGRPSPPTWRGEQAEITQVELAADERTVEVQ